MDNPDQPAAAAKKIRIKAGAFEFEAEGGIEDYRESLQQFMGLVEKVGVHVPAAPAATTPGRMTGQVSMGSFNSSGTLNDASPSAELTDFPIAPPPPGPIGEEIITRLYRRDGDGISLLALPPGDEGGADALVALLYGFQRLLNRQAVTGYALMRAAKQSGVNIPRIDTTMAKRQDFVLVAGMNRGKVYSLNNRGVAYAEGVLRRTLE